MNTPPTRSTLLREGRWRWTGSRTKIVYNRNELCSDGGGVMTSSPRWVTSAVRGEEEQSGSNNHDLKTPYGAQTRIQKVTIGQQWTQPCVAPPFSGTKRSFFLALFHSE